MSTLEAAFTAWLAFLSSVSVDTSVVLNPAATNGEIEALEIAIGFELPEDLKALYKVTNGQQDPFRVIPKEGQYAVNLFADYEFLTIDQALSSYEFQLEIREEFGSNIHDYITVRRGDFVDRVSWQKGWLPIAGTGASQIAVDLAPPRRGTYGQLVIIGPDEDERAVISTSLREFFITAANNTPKDECTLQYGVPDTSDSHLPEEHRVSSNRYILHINAEWNYHFYQDYCVEEPFYEQPEYLNHSNAVNTRFIAWLADQDVAADRINHISNMSSPALSDIMESSLGNIFVKFITKFFNGQSHYLSSLGFKLACQKATEDNRRHVLSIDEYRLFHRYLTIEGIWTEQDYEQADAAMRDLPEVEASGTVGSGSTLCTSMPLK